MNGMKDVLKARKSGVKPSAIFMRLVPENTYSGMGNTGVVTTEIGPNESLADLDFRPLHGQMVCLEDHSDCPKRLALVEAAILAVQPEILWLPYYDGDGFVLRIHRKDKPMETHRS
jgi:hypothetical protein